MLLLHLAYFPYQARVGVVLVCICSIRLGCRKNVMNMSKNHEKFSIVSNRNNCLEKKHVCDVFYNHSAHELCYYIFGVPEVISFVQKSQKNP